MEADYAGPHGQFPGLDQINVRLPHDLAGQIDAVINVIVDGKGSPGTVIALR